MKEFEFTLKFTLPNIIQSPEDYINLLGENGCDDALVGIAQKGRIALQFNREAKDAYTAVTSAISDVKAAIPNAKLIESSPDLVGLTDIAKIIGVTRQYLRKLETTKGNFPQPVYSGSLALWHLLGFLQWYESSQNKEIDTAIKEIASINMQINIAREWTQFDSETQAKMASLPL